MSQQNLDINRAMAHVKSSAVQPTYGYGAGKPMAGFNAGIPIVRNGAGDYELTLLEDTSIADVTIIAPDAGCPLLCLSYVLKALRAVGTNTFTGPGRRGRPDGGDDHDTASGPGAGANSCCGRRAV